MKRFIYILLTITISLVSCEKSLKDTFEELDLDRNVVGDDTITLSDDDYAEIGINTTFFESLDDAKELIPDFLTNRYPVWGKGSSVLVNYDLEFGTNLEEVVRFTDATIYQLGLDDYATTGNEGAAFYPEIISTDFIPQILDNAITTPEDGAIVLARYDQFFMEPVIGLANIYQASFPTNYGDFENIDLLGAQGWTSGSANVQGSGFDSGAFANEDWLISPEIDLTGLEDLKFQINQEIDLFGAPVESIDIIISTDYVTGSDPLIATWTALSFDKQAFGDLTLSEDFDFSAYDGETIHIAFKYTSTDMASARWRIESFAIKTIGIEGEFDNKGDYYTYDGSGWEAVENVLYLSSSHYDAMGEDSGRPGRRNNFSNSIAPEDYIPTFLRITPPYNFAQDEDQLFVIYKFFNGSNVIRGNSYSVINGEWTPHQTQLQFGHDGNKWIPDNTIKYIFSGSDYTFISTEFATIYPNPASNLMQFSSFDRRASGGNIWSDDMLLEAIDAVLDNLFPDAEIGQKYQVTFEVFTGSRGIETQAVIKAEDGEWAYQE